MLSCHYPPFEVMTNDWLGYVQFRFTFLVIKESKEKSVEEQEEVCTNYDAVFMNKHTATAARLAAGSSIQLMEKVLSGQR